MLPTAAQVLALVQTELALIPDDRRRGALQTLLRPPELRSFKWEYGRRGERHDVWVVGESADARVALVYTTEGFGPTFPWGFVLLAADSLGMDSQWRSGLEDAAIGAGLLDAPPGYVVPGPR